jgi:hypothetical protein
MVLHPPEIKEKRRVSHTPIFKKKRREKRGKMKELDKFYARTNTIQSTHALDQRI